MYSSSFYSLITKQIRITNTTATINKIFVNKFDSKLGTERYPENSPPHYGQLAPTF